MAKYEIVACILTVLIGLGCASLVFFTYPRIGSSSYSRDEIIAFSLMAVVLVTLTFSIILLFLALFKYTEKRKALGVTVCILGLMTFAAAGIVMFLYLTSYLKDKRELPNCEAWILACVVIGLELILQSVAMVARS